MFRGRIGNQGFGHVVLLAAFVREVKLPEIVQARGFLDRRPGFDRSAFVRAVIHDCDARVEGVDDRGGPGGGRAVVGRHVKIDYSELIGGADEIMLLVPIKVAKVGGAEGAERDDHGKGMGVFARVGRKRPVAGAQRVRLPGAWKRRHDGLARAGNDVHAQAFTGIVSPGSRVWCEYFARTGA